MGKVLWIRMAQCLFSAVFFIGCGLGKDLKDSQSLALSDKMMLGVTAFQKTIYAYVRSSACVNCHGNTQNPVFASPSSDMAYGLLKNGGLVNFSTPSQSRVVAKSKDGHCGAACNTDGSALTAQVQAWWDQGECIAQGVCVPAGSTPGGGSGGGGATPPPPPPPMPTHRVMTGSVPVPANLAGNFVAMTWDLDALGADFAGVDLVMEIRIDAGGYEFREPRLVTPANAFYIRNILVYVNNNVANTTYTNVETTVGAPGAILSPASMVAIREGATDRISLGFLEIRRTTAAACKALARFTANVMPRMQNTCATCHGGANAQATSRFSMNAPDAATLCARALQRVNKTTPLSSALIQFPLNQAGGHPAVTGVTGTPNVFTQPVGTSWVDWIAAER